MAHLTADQHSCMCQAAGAHIFRHNCYQAFTPSVCWQHPCPAHAGGGHPAEACLAAVEMSPLQMDQLFAFTMAAGLQKTGAGTLITSAQSYPMPVLQMAPFQAADMARPCGGRALAA